MKKFYSLALAAAVALSASAIDVEKSELKSANETLSFAKRVNVTEKVVSTARVMKAHKAAGETASVEGVWTFHLMDDQLTNSSGKAMDLDFTAEVEYDADYDETLVWFEDAETGYYGPYVAIYDETAGTLTFDFEVFGFNNTYNAYECQMPLGRDPEDNKLYYGIPAVGQLNADCTELTFADKDAGLGWALVLQDYSIYGWYELFGLLGAEKETSGINDVEVANPNAPAVYYNLQGVRVANPENGLFIRMQDGKATKVLVK